eukprot:364510-Chlamydomonas_euryale.AAC.16
MLSKRAPAGGGCRAWSSAAATPLPRPPPQPPLRPSALLAGMRMCPLAALLAGMRMCPLAASLAGMRMCPLAALLAGMRILAGGHAHVPSGSLDPARKQQY